MLTYAVYHFVGISQGLTIFGTIHRKLKLRNSGPDPMLSRHRVTNNARICGWFGAQRKTSPATCVC